MRVDSMKNGIVIDHIASGKAMDIYNMLGLDALDCTVAILRNVPSKKMGKKILGSVFAVLGIFGLLEYFGILSGVPILALGIPAVLSLYFDLFSGFVQALVFSLLSMVYIAGACPPPEEVKK